MKTKLALFAFFYVLPFVLFADNKVDSLMQQVTVSHGEEKARTCLKLMNTLKFSDSKTAEEYGFKGLKIARQKGLEKLESKFLISLGIVSAIQANYPESISYYYQAMDIFKKLEDVKGIAQAHNNIGMTQARLGDYEEAMEAYQKAKLIYQTLEDSSMVLLIKGNISNLDYKRGNYGAALQAYNEILEHALRTDSKPLTARYYGNVGRALYRKGDYSAALSHYYKALPIMDSLENKSSMLNLYNNIGMLFSSLKMSDLAIENYEKALSLYDATRNKHYLGNIYTNLSQSYINKKEYDTAYSFIQKALAIYETKDIKSKGNLLQNLATIHLERSKFDSTEVLLNEALAIGEKLEQDNTLARANALFGSMYIKKKEIKKAEEYLLKAEDLYEKIGEVAGLNSTVETLAQVYQSLDKAETAQIYRNRNALLKDSLHSLEKMDQIIRLELERERVEFLNLEPVVNTAAATESSVYPWLILFLISGLGAAIYLLKRKGNRAEKALHKAIFQVAEENKTIKKTLDEKNLELTFLSLDIAQRDVFLKKLKSDLEKIAKKTPENKEVRQLINSVHVQNSGKEDWTLFKQAYQQVFPHFFDKLLSDFPTLSSKELRHCALIRLNIPLQEVSEIFGISVNSVHKARHRLRTKLDMSRNEKLEPFILKY